MKVHDLQQFLRSLAQPVTASGGKKVADELERAAAGFEQFKDMSITDFCEFLDRANHLVTTGQLPTGGRGRAGGAENAEAVQQATQRLMELYERALEPGFDLTTVRVEVQRFNNLRVEDLKGIAREMGLNRSFRRKEDALEAIERRITERRGGDRAQGQPTGARAPAMRDDDRMDDEPAGRRDEAEAGMPG